MNLPIEIINHIIGYAMTPIQRVLKEDIENFVETSRDLYKIYYTIRMGPIKTPAPTLHMLVNHILAFDYRFGHGLSIMPHENNMRWGALTVSDRDYLIRDIMFYYNIAENFRPRG